MRLSINSSYVTIITPDLGGSLFGLYARAPRAPVSDPSMRAPARRAAGVTRHPARAQVRRFRQCHKRDNGDSLDGYQTLGCTGCTLDGWALPPGQRSHGVSWTSWPRGLPLPQHRISRRPAEEVVWQDVEGFLRDPGPILRQLAEQMAGQESDVPAW
jgi:hypothetical protein